MSTLDIRGVRCPMNALKVKLALEPLPPGATLEVVLDAGEGLENVPRAAREAGHAVEVVEDGDPARLRIRKASQARGTGKGDTR